MDISLKLAKLAKEKGFKIETTKFYSDKKNGSRNSAEPRDVNSLKADEQYGEMYACVDTDLLKKWVEKKVGQSIGDLEEDMIKAIEDINTQDGGSISTGIISNLMPSKTEIKEEEIMKEETEG